MTDDPYAWPGLDRTQPADPTREITVTDADGHRVGAVPVPADLYETLSEEEKEKIRSGKTAVLHTPEGVGEKFWMSSDGKITYHSAEDNAISPREFFTTGDGGVFLTAAIDALEPGLYLKCSKCEAFSPLNYSEANKVVYDQESDEWLCERCA